MKYIDRLTDEQMAAMKPYAQKWIDECLRAGTTEDDWQRTERGIRASYRAARLKEPRIIVRTTSPLACVIAGPIAARILDQSFGVKKGAVGDAVHDAVGVAVHDAVGVAVDDAVHDAVRVEWYKYNGGHFWGSWAAWKLFCIDICQLELDNNLMALAETCRDLSSGAGWWWPHRLFCIVAPRHDEIHRDQNGRLHCEFGPALRYPDGWSIYSWHGIRIPAEWIEHKEHLAVETALTWQNIEQRRCAAEILGWNRVLSSLDIEIIDEDHDPMVGTLLRANLPDAQNQLFLKVLCGTGKTFVLPCVHNNFKTALEANAASWGANGIDPNLIRNRQWRT